MRRHSERGIALITVMLILMAISALLVGVTAMAMQQQQARFQDHDRTDAFYAAQAGAEKMTNDLGRLFAINYAPADTDVSNLATTPPALSGGMQFVVPGGGANSGYTITRSAQITGTIPSGQYAGLKGIIQPYIITVTAKSGAASEVTLRRQVDTVAIPVFQFGMFSDTDLSYFSGPYFNFGGRVHTNGDLYLAKKAGSDLVLGDKVTVYGDVIRTQLANGYPIAGDGNGDYRGPVRITNQKDGCTPVSPGPPPTFDDTKCRLLGLGEGSITAYAPKPTYGPPPNYTPDYSARRAVQNSVWYGLSTTAPVTPNWYYNSWITNGAYGDPQTGRATGAKKLTLPITSGGASPIELIRRPAANEKANQPSLYDQRFYRLASVRILLSDNKEDITGLPDIKGTPVDLSTQPLIATSVTASLIAKDNPLITGFILVNMQNKAGDDWEDVTADFLGAGFSGTALSGGTCTPTGATTTSILRFQRLMDGGTDCTKGTSYWPNTLYDTREALVRDVTPANDVATGKPALYLGGVMHYVELDIKNLRKWMAAKRDDGTGKIMETTGYVVYFSDRRSNHNDNGNAGIGTETGEYGWEDVVFTNGAFDTGEDVNGNGTVETYGGLKPDTSWMAGVTAEAPLDQASNPNTVTKISATQARSNRAVLFRRALKLVNGNRLNMLTDSLDPAKSALGLTIASENPVYIQGDYNADNTEGTGTWTQPHVGCAVIADAVTLLSRNWNDKNSFDFPYATGSRPMATTFYRVALIAGKGLAFSRAATGVNAADFGTDGGTHNFLRLLESSPGGVSTYYKGSLVSLYYSRQATGTFKCCSTVYGPPDRQFSFDKDFETPSLLPPRTPMFRTLDITSFTRLTEPPTP